MDEYPLPRLDQLRYELIFGDHNHQILKIWVFFPNRLVDVVIMKRTKNNYKGICTTATEQDRLIFDYLVINKIVQSYKITPSSFPNLGEQYSIHHIKLTKSSLFQLL